MFGCSSPTNQDHVRAFNECKVVCPNLGYKKFEVWWRSAAPYPWEMCCKCFDKNSYITVLFNPEYLQNKLNSIQKCQNFAENVD
jgi:hypothetical protein